MGHARRRRGRSSPKRETQWFGLQFEEVILAADPGFNAFIILVDDSLPSGRGTVVATKGKVTLQASEVDADLTSSIVMAKVMALATNDAGAIVQDVFPFDNDVDDMGVRQLWTGSWVLPLALAANNAPTIEIEIDIKVKVKIDRKMVLALIMGCDIVNHINATGYIRSLVVLP